MNSVYPKVLVRNVETGNCEYVDFYTAASRQGSWFFPWDVLDQVLEQDGSVRKITWEEVQEINSTMDEIDASK